MHHFHHKCIYHINQITITHVSHKENLLHWGSVDPANQLEDTNTLYVGRFYILKIRRGQHNTGPFQSLHFARMIKRIFVQSHDDRYVL